MRKSLDNTNCLFFLNRKKQCLVAKICKYALSESQQTLASLAQGGGQGYCQQGYIVALGWIRAARLAVIERRRVQPACI